MAFASRIRSAGAFGLACANGRDGFSFAVRATKDGPLPQPAVPVI